MSKLREQLHQARDQYRQGAYPGDLASDILPARPSSFRWLFRTALGGAVAAALALVVLNRTTVPVDEVPFLHHPAAHHPGPKPTPIVYNLPQRMPLSLPASPFMPATPPVLVSFRPESLEMLQQPEELLGPRLLEQLNRRRFGPAPRPAEREPVAPAPATQGAVG